MNPRPCLHAYLAPCRTACAVFGHTLASLTLGGATGLFLGLSAPAEASSLEVVIGEAVSEPDVRAAQTGLSPLPTVGPELSQFDSRQFVEDRRRLMAELSDLQDGLADAVRPALAEIDLLLELAALHLAHRMLPEAQSFLAAVPDAAGLSRVGQAHSSSTQTGRRDALSAALLGFGSAATAAPGDWADAPLFDALHHIARGAHDEARPLLASARAILDGYPPALSDPAALQLFWSAIESGTWNVARSVAARLERENETRQSAGYRFLLGRAAEVGGDVVSAFDNYAAAAAGFDEWAQRARLALIELGRGTDALSAADARQLLTQARALWSGGALALATLQRLAELELAEERVLSALDVLGDIVWLHPGTHEAEAAAAQADALIDAIYARGLAGEMPLVELIAAHRAIETDYGNRAVFDAFAEPFADHLAANGASGLAAAEFGAIRARIAARTEQALSDQLADPDVIAGLHLTQDRLRLKHAAALMQGGRLIEAEALLVGAITTPDGPHDLYNLMRAQLYAATQRPAEVLATRMIEPNEDYLRLRAEAAFQLGDWDEARNAYEALLLHTGPGVEARDQINLLLAAHRSGDPDRVRALIHSFDHLDTHWTALAARLTADAPDVLPLRDNAARQRVEDADFALRQLQAAGRGGAP